MKRIIIAVLIILIPFFNMVTFGYGIWDKTSSTLSTVIAIGTWTKLVVIEDLDEEVSNAFYDLEGVETLQELYDSPSFQDIMNTASQTGTGAGGEDVADYTLNDVNIEGILWEVFGEFQEGSNRRSLGFLRLIDRASSPLLPVMPDVATSDTENFFAAYDLRNNITNNDYSFRLENRITMTTEEPIQDIESITFYAYRGLNVSGETLVNRNIVVSILNGDTKAVVRSQTTQITGSNISESNAPTGLNFDLITFNLTQTEINNAPASGYYVRIFFDGGLEGRGGNVRRSRVVIDDLSINLLDE